MPAVTVQGLTELRAGLKSLDTKLPKELNKVAKDSATLVSTTAKALAPKRSGKLAGAIKPSGTAKGAIVKVGGLEYHRVIHFGWAGHNIRPQPFLYDARDQRYAEVLEKFNREVQGLVDKVV